MSLPRRCPLLIIIVTFRQIKLQMIYNLKILHKAGYMAIIINGGPCEPMVFEEYCTGNKSDWEKFEKWAETVPYTLRNPLYHWTHLELQRYFDVHDILNRGYCKKDL